MIEEFEKAGVRTYERFSAVDGVKDANDYVRNLFKGFHRPPKAGEIGLWLSSLKIWGECRTDTLLLDDDVSLCDGFMDKLEIVYRVLKTKHPDFDLLYIGFYKDKTTIARLNLNLKKIEEDTNNEYIRPLTYYTKFAVTHTDNGLHGEGTFAYIISPKCTKFLNAMIQKDGISLPIDSFLLYSSQIYNLKTFCVINDLVTAPMYEEGSSVDTDIQRSECL
jgi:GR25 family glycosyltransferase involved in LPS biosynthesis